MSAEVNFSLDGPFSPGWNSRSSKALEPTSIADQPNPNVTLSSRKTPSQKKIATPKTKNTSPRSEFGYDDAYSIGDEDFHEGTVAVNLSSYFS